MANGILSLIQPGGSSGDKYNMRSDALFHFNVAATVTSPTSGEVGKDSSNNLVFVHDNIISVPIGMIISFISPISVSTPKVYIKNNSTLLNTTAISITDTNGDAGLIANRWYIIVYDGSNFRVVNSHISTNITDNNNQPASTSAVKTYVDGLISNRFKYIISNNTGTTPNTAKYNGSAGTLPPSANTEYIIYLVKHDHTTNDVYDEWITIKNGATYTWEKIGNTDMDVSGLLANISDHTFTPSGSVSKPTFTGNKVTTDSKGEHTHSVTAKGSVSSTFSGTATTLSGTTTGHQHTIAAQGITVKGTVTTGGSVSQPTFTGSESTTSTATAHSHQIAAGAISVSGTFNPSTIAITAGAFSGTEADIKMDNLTAISTSQEEHTHTINAKGITVSGSVTAAGTVSKPTFTGTAATISSTNATAIESTSTSHNHSIDANGISVSSTYTPKGTVSTPTVTLANNSFSIIDSVGSASSYSVANEVLTLTASTTPTKKTQTVSVNSVSTPTFTGTQATITSKNSAPVSISGGAHTHKLEAEKIKVSAEYTPAGSVSKPDFTGSAVNFSGQNKDVITISGGAHTHNIAAKAIKLSTKYTPAGTIANPTITSTSVSVTSTNATAIPTENAGGHSHTVTAAGTVSQPTFNGSSVTVTSTNESAVTTSKVTDNVTINYTPAGSVTSTFAGTAATTDSKGAHTHDVTATGTVSQPTFSGTTVTLTHTQD